MKFEDALTAMRNGKFIRLPQWSSTMFLYMKDEMILSKHMASSESHICWPIDICRDDWEASA